MGKVEYELDENVRLYFDFVLLGLSTLLVFQQKKQLWLDYVALYSRYGEKNTLNCVRTRVAPVFNPLKELCLNLRSCGCPS